MRLSHQLHQLTRGEFERLRLILSTYQDGSGQELAKDGSTLPGWRDFERSVALVLGGQAQQSKAIFDVLVPDSEQEGISWGVSCKMRRVLDTVEKTGRVTLELSNATSKFWNALKEAGLNEGNYTSAPQAVGKILITLIEKWHEAVSTFKGGTIDITKSFYLTLFWNRTGSYRLFQFPLQLPDPACIKWEVAGRRLCGKDEAGGTIFEWYGYSGGQLKYYPRLDQATWQSRTFCLEPLPQDLTHGIEIKAKTYFPQQWEAACVA